MNFHVSRRRDREPSRIPVKKLKRLSQKSRKLKVFVWKKILKITPLSSKLHGSISCRLRSQVKRRRIIASLGSLEKVRKKPASIPRKFRQTVRLTCFGKYTGTRKRVNLKKYQVLYTCCGPMSLHKNGDHRRCCAKTNLHRNKETYPGPPMNNIDPTLTLKAPYSQGDITVFGGNAGQQCIAMSLCALIYNNIKGINACNDLVQIMEMGNELFSTLSQCTGQVYLVQTELPAMIAMSENNYQLN